MKRCVRCVTVKPTVEFPAQPACIDGLSSWCKQCHRAGAQESARRNRDRINARNRRPVRHLECRECGAAVASSSAKRRYCSLVCQHRGAQKDYRHRKRATVRDLPFRNRVSRYSIGERDGWICQICTRPVDPFTPFGHPLAATIDHIVPLSRGGQHTEANVQLAHLGCNSRKGNRVEVAA